ncbi:hypothetical protein M413DRAFT_408423 [Hebeloma cylindrosporum]|uniref:Ecp2 effector protein domain-containing protein n=1 Tax=Hebeloma cylindrosporum TaxID=76867 RepID=A0A0C3C0Y4_HEBCY|nr:hypothetical protein M413DRAFT_408423 [Hebeloma cylindrosporum h7]
MFLKLSKVILVALVAATLCSAASIAPRDENINAGHDSAGKVNAPAVCVEGENDAQLCWDHDIRNHIFPGEPENCYGAHVTSAAEQAFNSGIIWNLRVASSSSITRLMSMTWDYGDDNLLCQKTVWNNIQNYRLAPALAHYTNESIEDIYLDIMDRTQCLTGTIVVDNRYGNKICGQLVIGTLPTPGRSFYPRSIAEPSGAVGTAC